MEIMNSIITWILKKRIHQIELFMKYPVNVQHEVLHRLIESGKETHFGKKYGFKDIKDYADYKKQVPLHTYEDLFPYIERLMQGEQQILWPSEVKWFAKSSGTTNARSKFIPVSPEALDDCHFKGGKDMLSLYFDNYPDAKIFTGKNLSIGGSNQLNHYDKTQSSYLGDVSAVIMRNLPFWAQWVRTPSLEIALMDEWESKIEKMAHITKDENVISLSGVPTWTLVLMKRILEITGKDNMSEVWPNLELFAHGAVSFTPYRKLFEELIPSDQMNYLETYNASEGFFGIQDTKFGDDMLLMLDYGIFYEFVPLEDIDLKNPRIYTLEEVELGKVYSMIISTNAGLWRYAIGDTVKFTSLSPFRIKIAGRTKHFINAFGEELMVENAEKGITKAAEATGAMINNFTAAPRYMGNGTKGAHEWVIEFEKEPEDMERFTRLLDESLRELNSDYDAKRYKDIALTLPIIHKVAKGSFYNWMKKRGKLGGQNKVPRLANNREYLDDLLEMLGIANKDEGSIRARGA